MDLDSLRLDNYHQPPDYAYSNRILSEFFERHGVSATDIHAPATMVCDSEKPALARQFWTPEEGDDMEFVKHEPMFFRASPEYALEHGGPITRAFLHRLVTPAMIAQGCFLDSRVHMLMPDWWPCIPGWHHDDVERSRSDGQPNYNNASYSPHFYTGIVGEAECQTEFAFGKIVLPDVELGEVYYKVWHPLVDAAIERGELEKMSLPKNQVWVFGARSFHQGVKCTKGGWRWFGRLTVGAPHAIVNDIRRNAMVYMEAPMQGW